MSNAFDMRPFAIGDFMRRYWVETGDLKRVATRHAGKQLERNYGISGFNAEVHIQDLVSELFLTVHDELTKVPDKFATMLDAKKYAVTVIQTRVANLVVPMMEQATIPRNNKSIARSKGKEVSGNEVKKDKDGNWLDAETFKLDPTYQSSFMGSPRKDIIERVDWASYDMQELDDWAYSDIDTADIEYSFGHRIPRTLSGEEQQYLMNAMSYSDNLRSEIPEAYSDRNESERLAAELYEEQLQALAAQPALFGHNGGPALEDTEDNAEGLITEMVGPLMQSLSPLEQEALIEVAKYLSHSGNDQEKITAAWYHAGDMLGKSKEQMRRLKSNIAQKGRKIGTQ